MVRSCKRNVPRNPSLDPGRQQLRWTTTLEDVAHMTDGPSYGSQLVLGGLVLNSVPEGSPSNAHGAFFGIGNRIVEIAGEIDNESIFGRGRTGAAVPPAANCDWQIIVACVPQGERDVGRVFYESHNSSVPLCIGRPSSYRIFVVRIGGGHNVTLEGLPQARDVGHSGQKSDTRGLPDSACNKIY
jgi:hypothetical protein